MMEAILAGIGFLIGLVLWMPFIIDVRIEAKLFRLEGWINSELIRVGWRDRHSR